MSKLKNFFIAGPANDYQPPIISYKAFIIYGLLLLLLRIFLGTEFASGAAVNSQTLMSLINTEREQRNLVVLTSHQSLTTAASQKSQDMIDRDYFAHIDPDGNYVWNKIITAGYSPYKILGENLAINFTTSEGMVKAWLDSPTHRANLLHTDFREQGLSALYGDYNGNYTNLTTSLFGALLVQQSTPPPPEPEPQPAPEPAPEPEPPAPPSESETREPEPEPVHDEPDQIIPPPDSQPEPETNQEPEPTTKENIREGENPLAAEQPIKPAVTSTENKKQSGMDVFEISRIIFTVFGAGLLTVLSTDSYIIYKHEVKTDRSHSSYHLLGFIMIILVSVLIWWW